MKFGIVVIGYNRLECIERVLESLNNAYYGKDKVDLIISIDKSNTNKVIDYANKFVWRYGEKFVKTYPERLGLRKHVLTCGDYVENYDAIAVFEDDIFASPNFYNYMKAAVQFYCDDDNIAGISLYQFLWNQTTWSNFSPQLSGYDTYFVQCAQSWGQIWMKRQWKAFKKWYEENCDDFGQSPDMPDNISSWPKTSWLKYHIRYCVKENKYFVYPYKSLSTNFSDVGQHADKIMNEVQVPFQMDVVDCFKFMPNDSNAIRYDVFFNPLNLVDAINKTTGLNISTDDICIDLFCTKQNKENKRYWLTTELLPYKIIHSYGLRLRPWDMNILYSIDGNEIFLYDTSMQVKNEDKDLWHRQWVYEHYTVIRIKTLLKLLLKQIRDNYLRK